MNKNSLPKVITFDGEARSGKGTIAQATKDYLRDECGYHTMLIDRGQTFRVLVVAATRADVDLNSPAAIDEFLASEENVEQCTQFVKDVYRMGKDERDSLLYTNEVGENSAKVGARPASQAFVANLTKKWLRDARQEGFDVVLIDGRALEGIASEMDQEGLCEYRLGLYFICNAIIGARRTLGYAATAYDDLTEEQRTAVDELVMQIGARNARDFEREVERLAPPAGAPTWNLPEQAPELSSTTRPMLIVNTSAEITKIAMSQPVAELVAEHLN
jgi:cytidylate kinase